MDEFWSEIFPDLRRDLHLITSIFHSGYNCVKCQIGAAPLKTSVTSDYVK